MSEYQAALERVREAERRDYTQMLSSHKNERLDAYEYAGLLYQYSRLSHVHYYGHARNQPAVVGSFGDHIIIMDPMGGYVLWKSCSYCGKARLDKELCCSSCGASATRV